MHQVHTDEGLIQIVGRESVHTDTAEMEPSGAKRGEQQYSLTERYP